MWTRGAITRPDPTPYPPPVPREGVVADGGTLPVLLPPPTIAHDPSDPTTWTVPVRWT